MSFATYEVESYIYQRSGSLSEDFCRFRFFGTAKEAKPKLNLILRIAPQRPESMQNGIKVRRNT